LFDWVYGNKRIVQIVLGIITIPFALWGISFYERANTSGDAVASVGGQKITEQEFNDSLRQQQDQIRRALGRNYNAAMFDSPAARMDLLEGLISQRLLAQFAVRRKLSVSDADLRDMIASVPAFQEDGKFSKPRYEALLRAENLTPQSFEASLRRDLMLQQLTAALGESGLASKAAAQQLARIRAQQREIAEYAVPAGPLLAQVAVAPQAVKMFYDTNSARFQIPESVGIEYVVLNADALMASEQVKPEDVKAYYEANAARFGEPEQRRASHILVAFKAGASAADKARAKERAEKILAEVRRSPASFAEIAKKNSDDPGSAVKGGDLDYFSRGMMVHPFEDAAFKLKLNEISGLVESDFGYHIIRLTGIKPGNMKTLDQARPAIEAELKKQQAGRRYAEVAEAFTNLVYDQSDSLQPAADRFKLPVQRAAGLTREAAPVPLLNNPRLLAALFTDDAIKNRRNTEAIEVAPGTLVAARVVDHKAASLRPYDEVKAGIEKQLQGQEALAQARKQGAELLEALKSGKSAAPAFGAVRTVSRQNPQGLGPEAVAAIFRADAAKLPAYAGVQTPGGYAIYRVSRVIEAAPDEKQALGSQAELGRANGVEEFRAFVSGLRSGTKVEINRALLEARQQQ
jgi:peptidyl-prolyl cis-trans isomerase D